MKKKHSARISFCQELLLLLPKENVDDCNRGSRYVPVAREVLKHFEGNRKVLSDKLKELTKTSDQKMIRILLKEYGY